MKEYLTIFTTTKKEILSKYQLKIKKQLQSHYLDNRTFKYTHKNILDNLFEEIMRVNTPIFKDFPLSWDLFRDRNDLYSKNSELHILSNEVHSQFKEELDNLPKKKYAYKKFIEEITILETLILASDIFKQNYEIVKMMFELNQFKWFKLIPNSNDESYLALKTEYSNKKNSNSLDTSENTFNSVRNLKNDLKSKDLNVVDKIDLNSIDFDSLEKIVEKIAISKIEENSNSQDEKTFMNTTQVAEMLHLEKQTIYGLVHEDKIPYEKVGQKLYFMKDAIINWVLSGRKKVVPEDEEVENFFNTKHKYNK